MAGSDNLLALLTGLRESSQRTANLLLEDVLARRRAQEQRESELDIYKEKLPLQTAEEVRQKQLTEDIEFKSQSRLKQEEFERQSFLKQEEFQRESYISGSEIPLPLMKKLQMIPEQKIRKEALTPLLSVDRQQTMNFYRDRALSDRLRKEFIDRPEVKEFVTVKNSVTSMEALLQGALKGDLNNRVALDQGLITMYNKLTDPNSVVRESEYARTPENLPLVNRIEGAITKIGQGGAGLTNDDRKALILGAKIIGNERGKTFSTRREEYVSLAEKYGIDPEIIVGTIPEFTGFTFENSNDEDLGIIYE